MSRVRIAIGLAYAGCALLMLLCASTPALAQKAKDARAALQQADRLSAAGDIRAALPHYSAAHAVLNEPTSGLSLARAQAALEMLVEARQTAAATAALSPAPGEPAEFAAARKAAAQMVAEIEPRLPVFGVIVSPVEVYKLRIDGVLVPEHAQKLRFRTNPGDHEIEIEAEGFLRATQTFTLAEGVHQLLQVSLSPEPVAPAPPVVAMLAPSEPAPSEVAPDEAEPSEAESSDRAQLTRGYVALAAGGAVLAAGAICGVLSFTETSEAKDDCTANVCPDRLRGTLETADTLANVANVAIPIGVIGVAYGLFELLTMPERPQPARSQTGLSLRVDARGAYATLRGAL